MRVSVAEEEFFSSTNAIFKALTVAEDLSVKLKFSPYESEISFKAPLIPKV